MYSIKTYEQPTEKKNKDREFLLKNQSLEVQKHETHSREKVLKKIEHKYRFTI